LKGALPGPGAGTTAPGGGGTTTVGAAGVPQLLHGGGSGLALKRDGELQVLQPGLQQLHPVTEAASPNTRPTASLRVNIFASPMGLPTPSFDDYSTVGPALPLSNHFVMRVFAKVLANEHLCALRNPVRSR